MSEQKVFRRIHGRVVAISVAKEVAKTATGTALSAGVYAAKIRAGKQTTPHGGFSALSTGIALASGALSARTFFSGGKGFLVGAGGSLALDALSTAANVASFSGSKGSRASKGKGIVRQEAFNTLLGNAAFVGGILAVPSSRRKLFEGAAKLVARIKGLRGI